MTELESSGPELTSSHIYFFFSVFFTCHPGQRPCSTGRAAPSRSRSGRLPCSASSAPGPGNHLTAERQAKCQDEDIYCGDLSQALAGTWLGWSQRHTTGACYLQWGLERRRNLPGSTDTDGCCLCTVPAGAVGGPTESTAQLMSAPARPPGSSSACPKSRQQWPCCLQSKNRRTLRAAGSFESCKLLNCSKILFKQQLIFISQNSFGLQYLKK